MISLFKKSATTVAMADEEVIYSFLSKCPTYGKKSIDVVSYNVNRFLQYNTLAAEASKDGDRRTYDRFLKLAKDAIDVATVEIECLNIQCRKILGCGLNITLNNRDFISKRDFIASFLHLVNVANCPALKDSMVAAL